MSYPANESRSETRKRRKAAHLQSDYERMLRAAERVTGRPHVIEARPDGSCKIVPYDPPVNSGDIGDYSWEVPPRSSSRAPGGSHITAPFQ